MNNEYINVADVAALEEFHRINHWMPEQYRYIDPHW